MLRFDSTTMFPVVFTRSNTRHEKSNRTTKDCVPERLAPPSRAHPRREWETKQEQGTHNLHRLSLHAPGGHGLSAVSRKNCKMACLTYMLMAIRSKPHRRLDPLAAVVLEPMLLRTWFAQKQSRLQVPNKLILSALKHLVHDQTLVNMYTCEHPTSHFEKHSVTPHMWRDPPDCCRTGASTFAADLPLQVCSDALSPKRPFPPGEEPGVTN